MAAFTLTDAAEITGANLTGAARKALEPGVAHILPWASASPIWSGPRPAEVERAGGTYGVLVAIPASGRAWALSHDPDGRMHVVTTFDDPGEVYELCGRRWLIRKLVDQVA